MIRVTINLESAGFVITKDKVPKALEYSEPSGQPLPGGAIKSWQIEKNLCTI